MNHWEIILGILFGLLVNEVTDISPWAARKLAQWSAYRWTTDPEMAAGYAEEWTAVIDDRPGKLLKLLTALRFTLGAAGRAAPRAGRRALRSIRFAYRYVRAFLAFANEVTEASPLDVYDAKSFDFVIEVKEWHVFKVSTTIIDHESRLVKLMRFTRRHRR
ncbi:hypothetical protein ACIOBK_01700 [Micromonospora chokoriensis]